MKATIMPNDSGYPYPLLNLSTAISCPPPPLDFVLPGLVAGTVGSLVAPGATGKSWLALQLAALVAAGADTLGFGETKTGRVLVLAAEDPAEVLWQRVHTLATGLSPGQVEELKDGLFLVPCAGRAGDLLDGGETAERLSVAGAGCRLIVIDTLSRWHTGEENERRDAALVMRQLERVAGKTGAAVVFLHHTSKAAALAGQGGEQQASRGSSVFVDEARWVAFLQTATEAEAKAHGIDFDMRWSFVRMGVSKTNYCARPPDIWLRRGGGGVLERYEMLPRAANNSKGRAVDDWE
jgi:RecA-family ATPase